MKKIILSQGQIAFVDDEDFEYLINWKWSYANGYAMRKESVNNKGKRKTIWMHRVILERKLGHDDFEIAEHDNRNPLDNRRNNLRSSTNAQNQCNRGSTKNSTSKYKGVSWHTQHEKWVA